jgi:hypothetical protein
VAHSKIDGGHEVFDTGDKKARAWSVYAKEQRGRDKSSLRAHGSEVFERNGLKSISVKNHIGIQIQEKQCLTCDLKYIVIAERSRTAFTPLMPRDRLRPSLGVDGSVTFE